MTQADRVHSTPPTNTSATTPSSSRRRFLVQAAGVAAGGAALGAALPLSAPAAAQILDSELIELGARFEPLVDRYYAAHAIWARAMTRSHTEQDLKFGSREERGYHDSPEMTAAWEETCERNGLHDACERQSAIFKEMAPLANAINAASVTSIEGFRAKALVALYEVAPLSAGDTEFSFDDAWPFQQLFTAVAELCGLKDKMAATGYALPDIGMVEAATDDDSEDEQVGKAVQS